MRSLNNFRAEQPHQHAMYYLRLLMTEVAWTKDELKEALDGKLLLVLRCIFAPSNFIVIGIFCSRFLCL